MDPSYEHLVAGTMGGLVATGLLYPLELVKTRMQVLATYDTMYLSFKKVLEKEGVRGFYKGMTPSVIAASGSWGGYFYFYEQSKARKLRNYESLLSDSKSGSQSPKLGTVDHLLCGVEAGVFLVFLFNPLWVIKTRLALRGGLESSYVSANGTTVHVKKYTGLVDAIKTTVQEEGVRGLYKGLFPALLLTSHGAIQFTLYERMKLAMANYTGRSEQTAVVSAGIGGSSKIVASTITYPYQLVKSHLQQRDIPESSPGSAQDVTTQRFRPMYKNTWDCVKTIWSKYGLRGFFRGVGPNALKVAPSSAVTFLIYEETLKKFRSSSRQ
jgi:solute carrier family 25 folate transporter 32